MSVGLTGTLNQHYLALESLRYSDLKEAFYLKKRASIYVDYQLFN